MAQQDILIVGAGFSGAVIGRQLADAGLRVRIIDQRSHVAGNCHTERDAETGIMTHVYGPHIFHTDDEAVWSYVCGFGTFAPYRHQVKVTFKGRVYSLPINLHTINQFFQSDMRPHEAQEFIRRKSVGSTKNALTFEEKALQMIGRELYEAFFEGYTQKQWGLSPQKLPASIFQRLPLRFSYDDNYFFHRYQGIPVEGYTALVAKILDHPLIDLQLNTAFHPDMRGENTHLFWSGALDEYFGFAFGRLGYRTLDFDVLRATGDYQGCAVMNYAGTDVPHTRITEHKYFSPWAQFDRTICFVETSRAAGPDDIPYYPIRLVEEKSLLRQYQQRAQNEKNVTFIGRLGTYRYLDMDVCIREAMDISEQFLRCRQSGDDMPSIPATIFS